ncbi:MAG TPA: DNA-directed RNA polymerase [Phycisphaerae bacterium]|nr:DNA-directed RNA polymerase [Phycisphaerae bacterium]
MDTLSQTASVPPTTDHPLLEEQLQLEEEMVRLGMIRFNDNHQRLSQEGHLSSTQAGLEIAAGGIDRVASKLTDWIQDEWVKAKKNGMKNKAWGHLSKLNPQAAAFIALRVVLDSLTGEHTYQRAAIRIGTAIEDEQRYAQFRESKPQLFEWAKEQVRHSPDPARKRTVMTWTTNKSGFKWESWGEESRLRVGVVMVEMVRRGCGIIDVHTKPQHVGRVDTTLYISPNEATMKWIKAYNLEAQLLCPTKMPTIIPPKDWTNPHDGGYWSERMTRVPLVKTSKKAYLEELALLKPTAVYEAVNRLQRTPWRVNDEVLAVVKAVWSGTEPVAGLPSHDDPPLPSKPMDIDTNSESRRTYRRAAAKAWDRRVQTRSRRMQCAQVVAVAERFEKYDAIYFPYQLDFRGRVYTQPSGLQPQGSDLAKGLLKFAEGKPLSSDSAVRWWKIHGANCFGIDKVSFADRLKWVEENSGNIINTSIDPLNNRWWTEADQPFMFLAWCLEYGQWFEQPDTFKSHLAINLDASCSGLQHFSAMLRDEAGATATNLVPGSKPRDIYTDVASLAVQKLSAMVDSEEPLVKKNKDGKAVCDWTVGLVAQMWLAYGVDRKISKRPVMTQPYGSTLFSCKTFVMEIVEERDEAGLTHPFGDFLIEASGMLAKIIWDAIGEVVVAARQAMDWLQEAAQIAANKGLPISWVTPSGFPVWQAYLDMSSSRVALTLGESVIRLSLQKETKKLDKRRQSSGISPNFVHSCDASALVMAVTEAGSEGITSFCCVHDSFGTHAADTDTFVQAIRTTFVRMYEEHDVLAEFKEELSLLGVDLPPLPAKGTLDIRRVVESAYCFA